MPVWLLPAIMTALGTAVQYKAGQDARDDAAAEMAVASGRQNELLDKSRELVMENLRSYDPNQRISDQEAIAQEIAAKADAVAQEGLSVAPIGDSGQAVGDVSTTYLADRAARARDSADRASVLAGLLGKFRAPTQLRQDEALENAEFASQGANLGSMMRGRARTDAPLIELAGQPDPLMQALGGGMQQYGLNTLSGQVLSGLNTGGTATSGAGVMGKSKPWFDITSGPRKL